MIPAPSGEGKCKFFIFLVFVIFPSTIDSTTFKTCENNVKRVQDFGGTGILSEIHNSKQYKANNCTEILQASNFSQKSTLQSNGFVNTVVHAYSGHHNLVIRPDDVWTAIMVQFSSYINKEAEKFRKKFVNFEGKEKLIVHTVGTLKTVSYDFVVKAMTDLIDKKLVDVTLKTWILPKFSTTTDEDRITCGIVFMSTMKKYFDYEVHLKCGIPYVTLEGTLEDWEEIERRLDKLKEYELDWWYDMLKPVIHQFVNAKKGKPDVEFWGKVCSTFPQGSGTDILSGWITVFAVFNEHGERHWSIRGFATPWVDRRAEVNRNQNSSEAVEEDPWPTIEMGHIPAGSVEVDLKINDNGVIYDSVMFAGHIGKGIEPDGTTLRQVSGWGICLKPESKEE